MAWPVWITPRARQDVVDLATYIGRSSPEAAERFFDEFDRLYEQLATSRELGQQFPISNPRLEGLRLLRIPRFPNHLALCSDR